MEREWVSDCGTAKILIGDCVERMRELNDQSVHCCVTSPPYWGLRDYGHDGQIGLESTPEAYVARMVEVFREVRRVLREDGTLWLNLGDSYSSSGGSRPNGSSDAETGRAEPPMVGSRRPVLKPKDLIGVPWRVAFALQADGWYLRQDIIWHKPNPMPESVTDRCTKAHEYVFLLTKSERYYYDAETLKERSVTGCKPTKYGKGSGGRALSMGRVPSGNERPGAAPVSPEMRNRRSVWTVTTKPYSGAHFAVMPAALVEPCIKAGCPEGGTVLDPFGGSGTTVAVAIDLGRNGICCELNSEYVKLAIERIKPQLAVNRWPLLYQSGGDQ